MAQINYLQYFYWISVATGLAAFTYWLILTIQDNIADRKLQEATYQEAVNKYIAQQNEQIESLRDNLRQYMARELSLLNQQRTDAGRIKFLANELSIDGKETQVLQR